MSNSATGDKREHGFTLIEVMAAVLLTSIVISVAVAFQVNLGSATRTARERLRTQRHAVALLDRVARDLAGTYFIAPSETDAAGTHPWIFLSRPSLSEGEKSDAVKFVTRNYQPVNLDGHASDLAVVAYYLNPAEDEPGHQLMRWRNIRMPEVYDPTFPEADDPNAEVIGENLSSFAVSFIDAKGTEVSTWSSAGKGDLAALPAAVKLEIAMIDPERTDPDDDTSQRADDYEEEDEEDEEDEGESFDVDTFSKVVVLPLRPLDWSFLESQVRAGAEEEVTDSEDDEGDGSEDDDSNEDFDLEPEGEQ